MTDLSPVVQVEDAGFSYGEQPVLRGLSFSLPEGGFLALTGSNGAGKSTLLRLLLRELPLQEGRVLLWERPVEQFHDWSRIGYLPQDCLTLAGGFPASVLEVVMHAQYRSIGRFRLPGRRERKRAVEALEQVHMEEYAGRLLRELSGGQLQRVMLARILATGSELLLLDEPTTGLDAHSIRELYHILLELNRRDITILMVTHDGAGVEKNNIATLCLDDCSPEGGLHDAAV